MPYQSAAFTRMALPPSRRQPLSSFLYILTEAPVVPGAPDSQRRCPPADEPSAARPIMQPDCHEPPKARWP
eukprot:scaffold35273_cov20-Prasinocladus_malaysianus.AAC.1